MKKRINLMLALMAIVLLIIALIALWNMNAPTPTPSIPATATPTIPATPTPNPTTPPHCLCATAGQVAFTQQSHEGYVVTTAQPLHVGECMPTSGVKVIDAGIASRALNPDQGVFTRNGESPLHQVTPEEMKEHLAQGLSSRDFLALQLEDGTVLYFSEHGTIRFQTPLRVVRIWTGNNSGAIRFSTSSGGAGLIDTSRYWSGASIQSLTGHHAVQVLSLAVYIAPALLN